MALEHFKTQVLLLHSQQSTLDILSAGFGDRYAVHVATSGTEALNTLGETPIHVIVSAQDLPGMSGLEALREAKKRSPDTIGILLAGDRDDGLEALVGDKEVFQIVRGVISPDALRNLIDTATKQVRLLAISESANDLAANVDEPVGEHIVMETAENGAAIISDGTGTLPVLRSHKVHIAPHAGGRNVDVLVLTQDQEFLATIKDSARGLHNVHYANTPAQAEGLVRDHKVGVLVTDAAMVGANIEALTQRLRTRAPRLVAVVAGRRDDGELLMDLINRGHVYRFLLKPVSPGRARLAIEASVKHHLEGSEAGFKRKAQAEPALEAAKPADKPAEKAHVAPAAPPTATPTVAAPPRAKPARKAPEEKKAAPAVETPAKVEPTFLDSGRFTATMTGLAATIGKSLAGADAGADGAGPSRSVFLQPRFLTAVAAVVIVAAGAGWWFTRPAVTPETAASAAAPADTQEPAPSVVETDVPQMEPGVDSATEAGAETGAASTVAAPPVYQALLDEARIARDAGEIVTPPESNAIQLYVAARTMAPTEPTIAEELEQVVNQALSLAEAALLEQRTEDAATALRMVRMANPENSRLPFLDAQVAALQLRAHLDQTRAAIREGRFEDASTAITAAGALAGEDTPDVRLLAEELAAARSAQRVDEVLALANQRLNEDALIEPSNDNARYYYELALSTDTGNTAAQQGLTIIASKLVLRARTAIDAGQLDAAESLLEDAGELDPASSEVAASLQALETTRADAEALRQAELQTEAAQPLAGGSGAAAVPGGTTLQPGTAANVPGPGTSFTANRAVEGAPGEPLTADSAGGQTTDPDAFVPISSLKRTNYVVPEYPRAAQRRNVTGWVDVSFTVTERGDVVDVGIMNSDPGDVFNESATDAISQWRFEPPLENGVPVPKRVAVRLSFDLQ